jgi:hypothetical protein
MGENIPLAGSDNRNDNKFEHAEKSSNGQVNYYVGNKDSGEHCHMWNNTSIKESGVVHRGQCNVCDDNSSSGSSGK